MASLGARAGAAWRIRSTLAAIRACRAGGFMRARAPGRRWRARHATGGNGRVLAAGPVAVMEADRIEAVAGRWRHAEQADGAARDLDSGFRQQPFGLDAKRRRAAVAEIGLVQCEQVEAVVGEQLQPRGQRRHFIEVDQQPEGAVAKLMHLGPHPPMRHRADIERLSLIHT